MSPAGNLVNEPASKHSAPNDYGLDDGFSITGRNRADSASTPEGTKRICFNTDKNRANCFKAGRKRAHSVPKPTRSKRILFQHRQEQSEYISAPTRTERILFQHQEPSAFCFRSNKNRANTVSAPRRTERMPFQHRQEPSEFCFSTDKNRAHCFSADKNRAHSVPAPRSDLLRDLSSLSAQPHVACNQLQPTKTNYNQLLSYVHCRY